MTPSIASIVASIGRRALTAALLAGVPWVLAACAALPGANEASAGADGTGCAPMVGRYVDAARPQPPEGRPADSARAESLTQVLGLDPSTGVSVPMAERAVEILHVAGDRYSLSLSKTTLPDAVSLWDTPARCVGTDLQLQTASRYESNDGVHVTRQKMKVTVYRDADATLVVRRELRERAIGLLDVRRGGNGNIELYRFPPLEGRLPSH